MKKLLSASMMIILSISAIAQTDSSKSNHKVISSAGPTIYVSKTDGVIMKKDGAMIIKGGKMTDMKSDYTCVDGTTITSKGTVTKRSGVSTILKEGEYVDKSGEVMVIESVSKNEKQEPAKKKRSFFKHFAM